LCAIYKRLLTIYTNRKGDVAACINRQADAVTFFNGNERQAVAVVFVTATAISWSVWGSKEAAVLVTPFSCFQKITNKYNKSTLNKE
jgi:hypothetical protein